MIEKFNQSICNPIIYPVVKNEDMKDKINSYGSVEFLNIAFVKKAKNISTL